MIKPIVQIGDPILIQPTQKVVDFKAPELKQLIIDLIDTADEQRSMTAGLAAPQIGVSLAVCICRRVDLEENHTKQLDKNTLWEVMINPEITKESKSRSIYWEACMSIGVAENALFGPVERPEKVTVKYSTPKGETKEITADAFFSHEIQHELDHLKGVLFLKYVLNPKNIWKRSKLDKYYDEVGDYPAID